MTTYSKDAHESTAKTASYRTKNSRKRSPSADTAAPTPPTISGIESGSTSSGRSSSRARLAIVPGYTHYNFGQGPDMARVIEAYLEKPTSSATQFTP